MKLTPFMYTNSGLYHELYSLLLKTKQIILMLFMINHTITRRYALNPYFVNRISGSLDVPVNEFSKKQIPRI